jgi:hypothetical protein
MAKKESSRLGRLHLFQKIGIANASTLQLEWTYNIITDPMCLSFKGRHNKIILN